MTSFDGLRALMRLIDSIAEADYFLDQLRRRVGHDDARFLFRAFLAATRNVGPTLETLMRDEPAFAAWYSTQRGNLGEEVLADLVSTPRLVDRPESNVWLLCASHLRDVLTTVQTCFRRFDVEPSARALFARETLATWQQSIDDLEAELGYPQGWTDVFPDHEDPIAERLNLLATETHAGDLELLWSKYEIE